jgi:hypothetical protein
MFGSVVIDLFGEPAWEPASRRLGVLYVPASTLGWWSLACRTPVLIDCRGRYADGLNLAAQLGKAPGKPGAERVIVTEEISPEEHRRAYLAGVDRIVVLGPGEAGHEAILEDLSKERRR